MKGFARRQLQFSQDLRTAAPQAGPISIYCHPCPASNGPFPHRGGIGLAGYRQTL